MKESLSVNNTKRWRIFFSGCKRSGAEQEYKSVIYRSLDLNDWEKFDTSQIIIPEGMERMLD